MFILSFERRDADHKSIFFKTTNKIQSNTNKRTLENPTSKIEISLNYDHEQTKPIVFLHPTTFTTKLYNYTKTLFSNLWVEEREKLKQGKCLRDKKILLYKRLYLMRIQSNNSEKEKLARLTLLLSSY